MFMVTKALSLLYYPFNVQDFIFVITSIIDVFVATIVAISIFQVIIPMLKVTIKSLLFIDNRTFSSLPISNKRVGLEEEEEDNIQDKLLRQKMYFLKKSFIRGLLLALELESANAILKMGIFTSIISGTSSSILSADNINNFIFFVGVLSVRIAINQTLRRFNIR